MSDEDPFATQASDYLPRQLGRYHYRRPLASGGLGVVSIYFDTELNREVALKEIRIERADDPRQRSYFCGEAEVTGTLEHPGVVPIYSMGTCDEGRPYYAMRLIGGSELRDHICQFHDAVKSGKDSASGPRFRQLLRYLIDVCNVIQYSHSRGVLHRDLKSSNVMLGRYGETLVIDWGLAKATGIRTEELTVDGISTSSSSESVIELSKANLRHTQDGMAMGTIAYAPPEQLNGKVREIDARSDIYSLGAMLYEILVGEPPCTGMGLTQALRAIEGGAIPAPHVVRSDVPRPLSAMACKAISAAKANRYQTAEQLKNDLQCWLDDQPVSAYPETRRERISRWKRRHETFVRWATASLLLVTVVSLLAMYRIDLARKQQEQARSEATRLYQLARTATDQLLTRTSDRLSDLPDASDIQRGLLLDAVASYQRMAEVRTGDPELQRESARASIGLAEVQRALLETDDAIRSLQSARETLAAINTPEDQMLLAQVDIQESRLQGDKGDFDASKTAILRALPITERFIGGSSASVDAMLIRGQALIQRGIVASDFEDHTQAIESFESAGNTLRLLLDRELTPVQQRDIRLQLTRAYNNEALQRRNTIGDDKKIADRYSSAMSKADWLSERYPTDSNVTKEYAAVLNNYGNFLLDSKDLKAAESLYQRSVDFFTELAAKQPTISEHKERLALALTGLGNVANDAGNHSNAIDHFAAAVEASDQLIVQNRNRISFLRTAAQANAALGGAIAIDEPERAEAFFHTAIDLLPKTGSDDLRTFIEGKQLDLLKRALDAKNSDGLASRLADFVRLTSTLKTTAAQYNSACAISSCCRLLPQSEDAVVEGYLDIAMQRLTKAIEMSPEYWSYIADDVDLSLLKERRRRLLDSIRPAP